MACSRRDAVAVLTVVEEPAQAGCISRCSALEVENPGRLDDREAVVLLHQAGHQLFQVRDPRPQEGVLGGDPVGCGRGGLRRPPSS